MGDAIDAYRAPTAGNAAPSALPLRAFGILTALFGFLASSCTGFTLVIPAPLSDRAWWLVAACAAIYLLSFVPALAGVLALRVARPLFLAWSLATLAVETASMALHALESPPSQQWALACNIPLFMAWPAICFVAFAGRWSGLRPAAEPR